MDYTSRYGMDFNPFIKNSNEVVIQTSEYKEIIYRLNYLLDNKGFDIIIYGCHNTTIFKCYKNNTPIF